MTDQNLSVLRNRLPMEIISAYYVISQKSTADKAGYCTVQAGTWDQDIFMCSSKLRNICRICHYRYVSRNPFICRDIFLQFIQDRTLANPSVHK